jgi:hypothetical protein
MTDLHRTNINLYTSDVDFLQRTYGSGWTGIVRNIIHTDVERRKSNTRPIHGEISRRYIDNTEVPTKDIP